LAALAFGAAPLLVSGPFCVLALCAALAYPRKLVDPFLGFPKLKPVKTLVAEDWRDVEAYEELVVERLRVFRTAFL
jgi:hypothetical protein